MLTNQLERLNNWLTRRMGIFELTQPVVIRHGSMWLRIAPREPLRWFSTDDEALRYGASGMRGEPNGKR